MRIQKCTGVRYVVEGTVACNDWSLRMNCETNILV